MLPFFCYLQRTFIKHTSTKHNKHSKKENKFINIFYTFSLKKTIIATLSLLEGLTIYMQWYKNVVEDFNKLYLNQITTYSFQYNRHFVKVFWLMFRLSTVHLAPSNINDEEGGGRGSREGEGVALVLIAWEPRYTLYIVFRNKYILYTYQH